MLRIRNRAVLRLERLLANREANQDAFSARQRRPKKGAELRSVLVMPIGMLHLTARRPIWIAIVLMAAFILLTQTDCAIRRRYGLLFYGSDVNTCTQQEALNRIKNITAFLDTRASELSLR